MKEKTGNISLLHSGVVAVIALLFLAYAGVRPAHGMHTGKFPGVGNHLPSLELKDLQGKKHPLEWTLPEPKSAIIFFFEPRCADCLKEMVFMDELWSLARDFGLVVFAVEGSGLSPSETQEAMRKYRQFYGEPAFPVIPDPDFALSSLFNIRRLPTSFLLERHGVVLSRSESFEDIAAVDLTRKTEQLLKVEKGFFSFALRGMEISAEREADLERSLGLRTARAGGGKQAPHRIAVGDLVPGFEFIDINGSGKKWRPSFEKSGLTIVFFWGALCRPCIQEMAFLNDVYAYERGMEIIAVEGSGLSPERTARVMERYRRFHPLPSYPIVPDPDFRLAGLFGVKGNVPQTFFIDSTGKVIYHTGEFLRGNEEAMKGKIELALHLESGSLTNRMSSSREGIAFPVINEAPSIRTVIDREEEFRTNLVAGDTYYMNWEFDKALPHYLRCLEIIPGRVTIQMRVAKIYERQGKLEEALANWKKVLELEPDNEEALARIRSLSDKGRSEKGDAKGGDLSAEALRSR
ncbi:redoxin domain-containing protein [Candidatus Moduliflexota bacterium]